MESLSNNLNLRQYSVEQLFSANNNEDAWQLVESELFARKCSRLMDIDSIITDVFDDKGMVKCCFIRLPLSDDRTVRFDFKGTYQLNSCNGGGWLLKSSDSNPVSYWVPVLPTIRRLDAQGRILSEKPASITGFNASLQEFSVDITIPENYYLDMAIWRFAGESATIPNELEQLFVLEKQPFFLFSSHTNYRQPADLFKHLIHGHVYENKFDWKYKRKICSELDASSLYLILKGLELATNKKIYRLLKHQVVFSIIVRQADDGGWHHGEWTDLMESHYRLHCGGMQLLEAAFEEDPQPVIENALKKAAAFITDHVDKIQFGIWFLHDSLEESVELMNQSGSPWIPSKMLGKSLTNKMILNTHLDTMVTMDRYRKCVGDNQYDELLDSAAKTTEGVLMLRPAEWLYRPLFRAIHLTLLPEREARQLPLLTRAVKRLTWKYLIPKLHVLKRKYPRFVMPGGVIERHLSPIHFNVRYQSVNIMDLTRFLRRFPNTDLSDILEQAINVMKSNSFLDYLSESEARKDALGFWAEALYHLCMLSREFVYRRYLAEAIIYLEKTGQGLPPSFLGTNTEHIEKKHLIPCLLLDNSNLKVANLSYGNIKEFLVVNVNLDSCEKLSISDENYKGLKWFSIDQYKRINEGMELKFPPASTFLAKNI